MCHFKLKYLWIVQNTRLFHIYLSSVHGQCVVLCRKSKNCRVRSRTHLLLWRWTTAVTLTWTPLSPKSGPSMKTLPTAAERRLSPGTRLRWDHARCYLKLKPADQARHHTWGWQTWMWALRSHLHYTWFSLDDRCKMNCPLFSSFLMSFLLCHLVLTHLCPAHLTQLDITLV